MAGQKIAAAVLAVMIASPVWGATAQKKQSARAIFDRAETARHELLEKPIAARKLAEYQSILKLYRNVTILAPTIHQAPDSLFFSAELNKELAVRFPGEAAKYRAEAKRLYQALLKGYPENRYRTQTNQALAMLDISEPAERTPSGTPISTPAAILAAADLPTPPQHPKGAMAQVSSIREWSTPSYTRVVIGLDDEVKFEAGRIPDPDRIYFDLHNTHPIPALKEYSKDIDDGLLKKVRLGVNRAGLTRVVLEVGHITTYSAFLLPNPYRLVVDIQGTTKPLNQIMAAATPPPTPPVSEPAKNLEPVKTAEAKPPRSRGKATAAPPSTTTATTTPAATTTAAVNSAPLAPAPLAPVPIAPVSIDPSKLIDAGRTVDPLPVATTLALIREPEEIPATAGPTSEPVFEKVRNTAATRPAPVLAPSPNRNGMSSLTRALGLKIGRIVIDAGHGGHDTGTIGPSGYTEKELTLDVAQRLGQLVQERLGSEVVYTRNDDTFIPLETRTAIANQKQADLFVSVHANASRDTQARGVETYYLSFSTSPEAMALAARENAVSEKSIHELQDLVKKITLYEKVEESKEFAGDVQKAMYQGLSRGSAAMRNRGVKKAPFVVLIGANMPSILAEISFVSNPQDEKLLKKPEYRQKIAESLFRGIQRYSNSLGGVKVASQHGEAPELRDTTRE